MDGIILHAYGNPCYWKAAYNMAMSLRLNGCSLPVMLLHDGNQKIDLSVFDYTEKIKIASCPALTKTKVYFQSPFENTLYLDVDGIAMKDITPLFRQLKESGVPYAHYVHKLYNESDYEYPEMFWASRDVIEKYYGCVVKNLPATQTSIMFLKKCDETDSLINRICELIEEPVPVSEMRNLWGGGQPDELYTNIALAERKIHKIDSNAMFFGNRISPKTLKQIENEYYFLSIFGGRSFTRQVYLDFYDRYLIKLFRSKGYDHRYKISHVMNGKLADENKHLITLTQRKKEQEKSFKPRYTNSPEKIHLITTYYKAKSQARQGEIDFCLRKNIEDKEIDLITVLSDIELPFHSEKLKVIRVNKRATFNECLKYASDITVIANSDIYFESANLIKQLNFNNHFAITRHDLKNGRLIYKPYSGSQDVWIGKGIRPIEQDVEFGRPRCDQIISYHLGLQKKVMNPAKMIKAVHLHASNERSYSDADELKGKGAFVADSDTGAFKNRMLIIQPGQYGDILIVLPIARHYYEKGYLVDILCPASFHDIFKNIDYATPVDKKQDIYSKVLDLSFGINKTSDVHYWWTKNMHRFESFVDAKYELAGVIYPQPLVWKRNYEKEKKLYDVVATENYTLVHEDYGIKIPVNGIRVKKLEGYNIFDWYLVIKNAKEIHCIDSSISNFINYLNLDAQKYIYPGRNGAGVQMAKYNNWNKNEVSV